MLCQLLTNISTQYAHEENSSFHRIARIVGQLNAWSKKWVEQPDYDKRLNALKEVKNIAETDDLDMDLGLFVIYNCFYFLRFDKDIGMRDSASEHLKLIIPKLIKSNENHQDVMFLINDVFLNFVGRTLKYKNDKNDIVRNEAIILLGTISRECSEYHPVLHDMYLLTDQINPDLDFFENITHLQSHRHVKALLKLCSTFKTKNIPNRRTLIEFILPIAKNYLLNENYSSKHTLIDAAIETIGIVCQLLPWHHYQAIVRYYLDLLRKNRDYQKQLIRLVVTILDAFHFDISNVVNLSHTISDIGDKSKIVQLDSNKNLNKSEKEKNDNIETHEAKGENTEEEKMDVDEMVTKEDDEESVDLDLNEDDKELQSEYEPSNQPLSFSAGEKIVHFISKILIPKLNDSITEQSSYDTKHTVNRRKISNERLEEECLRIPITLAVVKLLQKMPTEMLDDNISGVLMKACTFLKSPLKSVRMLARDTLKKIMMTLGGKYLAMLINQMTSTLIRGFQVHVLSITTFGILNTIKDALTSDDIESCLKDIIDICLHDIFGDASVEKEIKKIGIHTPEARPSTKSYLIFQIVASNISESSLFDLILPLKEYLAKSCSQKIITKIQECFQKIADGLIANKNISSESLVAFIIGTTSESILELNLGCQESFDLENKRRNMKVMKSDCLLIPKEFKSRFFHRTPKNNRRMNAHVFIEFGLEMFHLALKRKKLTENDCRSFLSQFVEILHKHLKDSHVRVTILALKCLISIWNTEYEMPISKVLTEKIVGEIFEILHKYSTFECSKNSENYALVKNAFKAIVSLLRKGKYCGMDNEKFMQLLCYVEQDIHDCDKLPTAFNLLKTILHRKVKIPDIPKIIDKIKEIAITSQSKFTREEARSILLIYIIEYPSEKKINSLIEFFVSQMNYSLLSGRLSALLFIHMTISKLPLNILIKRSKFLFLSLGTVLVNDDDPDCRKKAAECIELLISKLDNGSKQELFDFNLILFNSIKSAMREMAAVLCSRFVSVEKEEFSSRIKIVLPILATKLTLSDPNAPGKFVRLFLYDKDVMNELENVSGSEQADEFTEQQKQQSIDHELIQTQNCILKIFDYCSDCLTNEELASSVDEIAYESKRLLSYEHDWVRENAVKLLDKILSTYDFDAVGRILMSHTTNDCSREFIYSDPETDLKQLTLDLCAQLIPEVTSETLVELVMKILLYMANMMKRVPIDGLIKEELNKEEKQLKIHMNWLLRRIRYIIHREIAKSPQSTVLRSAVFNWIEAFTMLIDYETLKILSKVLLSPLVREMGDMEQNTNVNLRNQAIHVANRIKKKIGEDLYHEIRVEIQNNLMMRRAERRRLMAQEKINDPIRAAKRKQNVKERKKIAKKMKINEKRGKIQSKGKRKRQNDDED